MEIWRLSITLKTGFHTTGTPRGAVVDVLREEYLDKNLERRRRIIIPATHIKGVVRSEAERIWGRTDTILKLFGPGEQEGAESYQEPLLRFTDAHAEEVPILQRIHVRIDPSTGSHVERGLYSEKFVPSGTVFTGYILSRASLNDDERTILEGSLISASHYGFGGSRSRGLGEVEVEFEPCDLQAFLDEVRG
ncbi:MAG: RAMP superfamily CRISPR-associated protein [Thermoplasmata archaeon]